MLQSRSDSNTLYYITVHDYCNINVYDVLQYTSIYSKPQIFSDISQSFVQECLAFATFELEIQ